MSSGAQWIGLFVGGGCGACLRHLLATRVDAAAPAWSHPGTLAVNLLGCLAIGLLAAIVAPGPWRVVVLAGLLGGFTTYSSFALLSVDLAGAGRWAAFAGQVGVHLVGGIAAVLLGAWLAGVTGLARPE